MTEERTRTYKLVDRVWAIMLLILYFQVAFLVAGEPPSPMEMDMVSFMAFFALAYILTGAIEMSLAPWLTDHYFLVWNKLVEKLGVLSSRK